MPLINEDDTLISSITPIKKLPIYFHLYALPSSFCYFLGFQLWTFLINSPFFASVSKVIEDGQAQQIATEIEKELEEDAGLTTLNDDEDLTEDLKVYNATKDLEDEEKAEPWSLEAQAAVVAIFTAIVLHCLIALAAVWSVRIRAKMVSRKTKNNKLEGASHLLVVPTTNNGESEMVPLEYDKFNKLKYFTFQKIKYIFDADNKNMFVPVTTMYQFDGELVSKLPSILSKGLSEEELLPQKALFGSNKMVMEIPPFWELFKERATAPFFVFQVFCVVLWSLDEYWYYSLFTLFMLVTFEYTLVMQQIKSMTEIRNMGSKSIKLNCLRNGKWVQLESDDLVPGDIVSLKSGKKLETIIKAPKLHPAIINMQKQAAARQGRTWTPPKDRVTTEEAAVPCDMILLCGRVIVDEAMLTGESIPQVKNAVDLSVNFDTKQHSVRNIVFGGTRIVQHEKFMEFNGTNLPEGSGVIKKTPDNGCPALVVRTSFRSSQGTLLRTILYGAKRVTANNKETFAFICFLLIFAIAAVWYLWENAPASRSKYKLLLESILIITSVVPPELPIELSLAVNNSLLSLSKLAIFCTEPFRIPFAGKVDVCCFDKTGTLTTDTLVVDGVTNTTTGELNQVENISLEAQSVLATCHALVLGNETDKDGNPVLIGDPLEKVCLGATDWSLVKSDLVKGPGKFSSMKIVHRHHFSSLLKRMSVITSIGSDSSSNKYFVTVKGAAEVLDNMLLDNSKPEDYDKQHKRLARRGIRVLALAYKYIQLPEGTNPKSLPREEIEKDLIFAGFVCVTTPLKKDSVVALKSLRESSHHLVMITGDHALTATFVALKTSILKSHKEKILVVDFDKNLNKFSLMDLCYVKDTDSTEHIPDSSDRFEELSERMTAYNSIAMTGPALEQIEKECKKLKNQKLLEKIIPMVSVFARTSPQQKENIINTFKSLKFTTLMCGDGTNDVGALKHAHVGVALLASGERKKKKKTAAQIAAEKEQALVEKEQMKTMNAMELRQKKMDDIWAGWVFVTLFSNFAISLFPYFSSLFSISLKAL